MADQIICCSDCEHSFDAMHDRALVFAKRDSDANPLCPLCAEMLRSSREWAIWNDCNGVFEVHSRRAEAKRVCDASYAGCDAKVVPVRVIREPQDDEWRRHYEENDLERQRA